MQKDIIKEIKNKDPYGKYRICCKKKSAEITLKEIVSAVNDYFELPDEDRITGLLSGITSAGECLNFRYKNSYINGIIIDFIKDIHTILTVKILYSGDDFEYNYSGFNLAFVDVGPYDIFKGM